MAHIPMIANFAHESGFDVQGSNFQTVVLIIVVFVVVNLSRTEIMKSKIVGISRGMTFSWCP